MAALLAIDEQFYGESGLYNALYQSDLQVESAEVDESGTAVVHLSGEYALGDACVRLALRPNCRKRRGSFRLTARLLSL